MPSLLEARTKKGLTQADVADGCGITRQYYGLIESGERTPPTPLGMRIARTLGVSADDLFGDGSSEPLSIRPVPAQLETARLGSARLREFVQTTQLVPVLMARSDRLAGFLTAAQAVFHQERLQLLRLDGRDVVEVDSVNAGFDAVRIIEEV